MKIPDLYKMKGTKHFEFQCLKDVVSKRIRWAREARGFSQRKIVEDDLFIMFFKNCTLDIIKQIENGDFTKNKDVKRLHKFITGMSKFCYIKPEYFMDENLGEKEFKKIVQEGYRKKCEEIYNNSDIQNLKQNKHKPIIDLGSAPKLDNFFGREDNLINLNQWIIREQCRLIAILGSGGIGKTNLGVKLAHDIGGEFDYLIWRTLYFSPLLSEILSDINGILSDEHDSDQQNNINKQLTRFLNHLKEKRCLIILDNVESVFKEHAPTGQYQDTQKEYRQFFKQIGKVPHKSCLLITSREMPKEIELMDKSNGPVRSLRLSGLKSSDSRKVITAFGSFNGTDKEWEKLIVLYAGNPLALELAAKHIEEVFDGNISNFLKKDNPIFNDIEELIGWHFNRLSEKERELAHWLTVNLEPMTISDLKEDILSPESKEQLSSTIHFLQRRFILEKRRKIEKGNNEITFTLQPVLREYIIQRLINDVSEEIHTGKINLLNIYAFTNAMAKDYVRKSQELKNLVPIKSKLEYILGNKEKIKRKLKHILNEMQKDSSDLPQNGYAAGNILNLLCYIESELVDFDFSGLAVRQAYLQGINLHNVNFAYSDFSKTIFNQNFGDLNATAFSSDGKYMAAGDMSGRISVWKVKNWQQLTTCQVHTNWVWSIGFSPDGTTLISAGQDEMITTWNFLNNEQPIPLIRHGNTRSVIFSPDGKIIASGGMYEDLKIWDAVTHKCIKTLTGHINV